MKTKEQSISTNTLFAASIGCFMQVATGIFVIISPFLLINILTPIAGQESAQQYLMFFSSPFLKNPIPFIIGLVFYLIIAILFLLASKKIKNNNKIKMWAIISLVCAFLLIHFGTNFLSMAAILGFIGSITGLIYKEEIKN